MTTRPPDRGSLPVPVTPRTDGDWQDAVLNYRGPGAADQRRRSGAWVLVGLGLVPFVVVVVYFFWPIVEAVRD
jgi:hypothetical protein